MSKVVKIKHPLDGLYYDEKRDRTAFNGSINWDSYFKNGWKRWQGWKDEGRHYHYEQNVFVLPEEYLT